MNSPALPIRPAPLVFGVGGLHRIVLVAHRQRLLRQAFDLGFRSFDVAPAYGNGLNEVELGEAFSRRRADIEITTKFGIPVDVYGERFRTIFALARAGRKYFSSSYGSEYARRQFSGPAMRESLHGSLRRLRCDYVDRLLIHEPLEPCSPSLSDELAEAAARLESEGKILSFGVCGPLDSVRHAFGSMPMDVIQIPFWDSDKLVESARERIVAYGVYRSFLRRADAPKQDFAAYVAALRASRPDLEFILASTSKTTLESWRVLFS